MDVASVSAGARPQERFRLLLRESWRYFAASLAALGVDYGLLVALTEVGRLHYLTSSAISYSCGAVLHYALSVMLVFNHRRFSDRRIEFIGFFGIGLIGLAATQAILQLSVEWLGMSYLLGKTLATGVSFVLNFAARRAVLFSDGRSDCR